MSENEPTLGIVRPPSDNEHPEASRLFEAANAVFQQGITTLISGVKARSARQLREAQDEINKLKAQLQKTREEAHHYLEQWEETKAKLSRPRNGGRNAKGIRTVRRDGDSDEVTNELMNEAYPKGKQPHSKSEMRRLEVMRKEDSRGK